MSILTKDRYFYKTVLKIAGPIALQNLIIFSVSMADTVMLGRLGEVSLSASSIGNHMFFVLMVLIFGVGSGASVMTAQYYGKKDIETIHKVMAIMYRVAIILAIIFILLAIFLSKQIISIFTSDEEVIIKGANYLKIVSISFIFYSITSCTIVVLRSIKTVKISLIIYSISLFVNIFFNWVLIFGKFGFSEMGVKGAAIATVISRITEFIVMLVFVIFFEKKIHIRLRHLRVVDKVLLKDFKENATPIMLNEFFWSLGASVISVIVARMGREVVAANSINNVTFQFSTLFIFGLASASSVIIGNTIGEQKYDKVREYAKSICVLSFIIGILASITIYITRDIIVEYYNVSKYTKEIAKEIMLATAILAVFKSFTSNIMMGILRGGGDNKFVFKVEMLFMWGISIPLGFVSAFILKLPIVIVFLIIKSDEILKSIVGIIRVKRGNWIKNVTRD